MSKGNVNVARSPLICFQCCAINFILFIGANNKALFKFSMNMYDPDSIKQFQPNWQKALKILAQIVFVPVTISGYRRFWWCGFYRWPIAIKLRKGPKPIRTNRNSLENQMCAKGDELKIRIVAIFLVSDSILFATKTDQGKNLIQKHRPISLPFGWPSKNNAKHRKKWLECTLTHPIRIKCFQNEHTHIPPPPLAQCVMCKQQILIHNAPSSQLAHIDFDSHIDL